MSSWPLKHLRNTARGIVIHDGQMLLMERWRRYEGKDRHYFSIPGGGIEKGETPEETAVREIIEETSIEVKVERQVLEMRDGKFSHKIYLCEYVSGEPHMPAHAPEYLHMSPDNRFKPRWVPIDKLSETPFTYWQPLQQPLIDGLADGFAKEPVIVSAGPPR